MYDILKAIAAGEGWVFDYGRADFHNLFKEVEQKNLSHLFLDPVKVSDNFNDLNVVESKTYSGAFMLLLSSDIDELSYDERYQQYIKPVIEGDLTTMTESIRCNYQAKFDKWEILEVINVFDYNFDGVLITYQVTIDE